MTWMTGGPISGTLQKARPVFWVVNLWIIYVESMLNLWLIYGCPVVIALCSKSTGHHVSQAQELPREHPLPR